MGVVIVGAGSIGLLLGSFLAESGIEMTLLVRREEQKEMIEQKGICRLNGERTESIFPAKVTTDLNVLTDATLVIIAVKYVHLHKVLADLAYLKIKSPLLFIQNGIGHLAVVQEKDFPHIAFATVEHGAFKIDDRTVSHNGVGALTIGVKFGETQKFNWLEKADAPNFPVVFHSDVERILMRKVIINCMINPLTAILEVKNGELLTNDSCYRLFESLYQELMVAFPEMIAELPFEDVKAVCRKTANNHSSMLADRLTGRPMEIETIVTAVIQRAEAKKKKIPHLKIFEQMLYAIDAKGEV